MADWNGSAFGASWPAVAGRSPRRRAVRVYSLKAPVAHQLPMADDVVRFMLRSFLAASVGVLREHAAV